MLDAIGAGLAPRIGDRDWKDIWLDSPEYRETREEIDRIKTEALALPAPEKSHESTCKCSMHGASQDMSNRCYRCYTVLGATHRSREAQQPRIVAYARIRLQQAFRARVHLALRVAVLPPAGSWHA